MHKKVIRITEAVVSEPAMRASRHSASQSSWAMPCCIHDLWKQIFSELDESFADHLATYKHVFACWLHVPGRFREPFLHNTRHSPNQRYLI